MSVAFAEEPEEPELSEAEQRLADHLSALRPSTLTFAQASAALGGAFLLYRMYMSRRMSEEVNQLPAKPYTAKQQVARSAQQIFGPFLPLWAKVAAPIIASGALQGLRQSRYKVPPDGLVAYSQRFATETGVYLHQTSTEALLAGFSSMVNRKVPIRVAAENSIRAFGVNLRTMNALVNIYTAKEPEKLTDEIPETTVRQQRAEHVIEAAIADRSKTIGENEVWTAREQIKTVALSMAVAAGLIPRSTSRVWITAKDELVCSYCGPMHKQSVKVGETFEVPGKGQFLAPPVHVNCRCQVLPKFSLRNLVAKSENQWETQPRTRSGRFGNRPPGTKVAEQEFDLERLVDEALTRSREPEQPRVITPQEMVASDITPAQMAASSMAAASMASQSMAAQLNASTNEPMASTASRVSILNPAAITTAESRAARVDASSWINQKLAEAGIVIPGEIVDPVKTAKPDRIPEGATDAGQPMYFLLNGSHLHGSDRNGRIRVQGVTLDADPEIVMEQINAYLDQSDRDEIIEILRNKHRFQVIQPSSFHTNRNPHRIVNIDAKLIANLIAHERKRQGNDDYGKVLDDTDMQVEIWAPHDDFGHELRLGPQGPVDPFDVTEQYDYVGEDVVNVADMVQALRIDDYVAATSPELIKIQVVPGTPEQDNGFPYASPEADYKFDEPVTYERFGDFKYPVRELKPDW